ncbi:hypothetical protein PRZ48_012749 [Zasmidium cellare]|uniref:Linalool dehydratase/isomerase domain-containing protein n=1 Tax=Zasmidium cellare TaxID=395010 RepID=A0ABR0E6B5_ZASCE|nr:hypothetical protein PRZ48_012749 [Zasmidium cellare]
MEPAKVMEHSLPKTLPFQVEGHPKLDDKQVGHLRHFHNIASAQDGDWPHMGTPDPEQAFVDAYRYQLATMAYAAGLAHYHRLPAMRSLFKPLIRKLIHKMLLPHVWNYWYLTSQSGIRLDPDITELRKPWADPIVKENIMHSGHLLLMISLYAMLFDDEEFERVDSLVFEWKPMFWGMGPEKYTYNTRSLQDAILKEMERENWVGVCCEPNMVFVVCNQFPVSLESLAEDLSWETDGRQITAMRYNDVRHGTDVASQVLDKYWPAIQRGKMIAEDGLFVDALHVRQAAPRKAKSVGFTAWACAFMNSWNSEWVQANFERQTLGYVTSVNSKTQVQAPLVALEIRRRVQEEGAEPNDPQTLRSSIDAVGDAASHESMFQQPLFGYVAQWLSELGREQELASLLENIDQKHKLIWEDCGCRYERDDRIVNDQGEWTHMDPFSGNAGIAYARLNVPDGQKKMWQQPWTREQVQSSPYIEGLDLSQGVDCLRGQWDASRNALIVTLRSVESTTTKFTARNLPPGVWGVYCDGALAKVHRIGENGHAEVEHHLASGKEVDFVIWKVE